MDLTFNCGLITEYIWGLDWKLDFFGFLKNYFLTIYGLNLLEGLSVIPNPKDINSCSPVNKSAPSYDHKWSLELYFDLSVRF